MSNEPPKETADTGQDNVVNVDFKAPSKTKRPPLSDKLRKRNVEKLEVFRQLVEQGMVMVVMDTRREGVQVPPRFADDFQLRLNFSHKFYIDDFEYDEYGVRASLSFNKVPYYCDIPWQAIYALNSQAVEQGVMWPDDVPTELQDMVDEIQSEQERAERAKSFQTFEGSGEHEAIDEDADDFELNTSAKTRPALRLVKDDAENSS
ncbi:MAG: hypothetical protein CMH56_02030 [Myxococcales bacterium]|nr:hypothetical protein [Myxococcales bacterium]